MNRFAHLSFLLAAMTMSACSTVQNCEEPAFYESAQAGKRIEPPEGLDPLPADKERVIPEVSPRPPRERGDCLDDPPTLGVQ